MDLLSNELQVLLLSHCTTDELVKLAQTDRHCRDLVSDDYIWKQSYRRRYDGPPCEIYRTKVMELDRTSPHDPGTIVKEGLRALIPKDFDGSAMHEHGYSYFHLAASLGHLKLVELFLSRGVEVDLKNDQGVTPFYLACINGQIEVMRRLLQAGANPHVRLIKDGVEGATALHAACYSNQPEVIKILVEECQLDINLGLTQAQTISAIPLHAPGHYKHGKQEAYLLSLTGDLEQSLPDRNVTVVHTAVNQNNLPLLRVLHQYGANLESEAPVLLSNLRRACHGGFSEIVAFLCEQGVRETWEPGQYLTSRPYSDPLDRLERYLTTDLDTVIEENNRQPRIKRRNKLAWHHVIDLARSEPDRARTIWAMLQKYHRA